MSVPTANATDFRRAEAVFEKMQHRVDTLAGERDRLDSEQRRVYLGKGKAIRGPQMRTR